MSRREVQRHPALDDDCGFGSCAFVFRVRGSVLDRCLNRPILLSVSALRGIASAFAAELNSIDYCCCSGSMLSVPSSRRRRDSNGGTTRSGEGRANFSALLWYRELPCAGKFPRLQLGTSYFLRPLSTQ
jgi:hypothetical protein